MALTDFIKPKWKHSNPEIRLKAVQEMGGKESDLLQEIAITDADAGVRMEAIGKITDENFLRDFASSRGDSDVIRAAGQRLNMIWKENILNAADTSAALGILGQLEDPETVFAIACETDDPELRFFAVEKISDPEMLCSIAENNCGLKAGLAIVEKLTDPESIRRVSETASNKKVKKQALEKLENLLHPQPSAEEKRDRELEELCIRAEKMTIAETREMLPQIREAWQRVSPDAHPLEERFQAACDRMEMQQTGYEKSLRAKEQRAEAQGICEETEKLLSAMPEDVPARMKEIISRWENADMSLLPSGEAEELAARFTGLRHTFSTALEKQSEKQSAEEELRIKKEQKAESLCRQAEELAADTRWEPAEEKWKVLKEQCRDDDIHDMMTMPDFPFPERFRKAFAHWEQQKQISEENQKQEALRQEKHLEELCEKAETACSDLESGNSEQEMRALQQEWKDTGALIPERKNELAPRFQDACDRFFASLREHRENIKWERWANLNQKEELCLLAESAAQASETEGVAEIVREMQKKWKSIGPVPRENSEEIWKRFNTACDEVYQRCLAEKKQIFSQLKELMQPLAVTEGSEDDGDEEDDGDDGDDKDNPDISGDIHWTGTAEKIKEIQARWNAVGSLPLGLEKDLRREFQDECNAFFENRRIFYQQQDDERQQNLKRKTAICEKAEALAASEEWNRAGSRLRTLQRQWKEIGPVPRSDGETLWKRFRTACDSFFERLKQMEPENLKKKEELCLQVEKLTREIHDGDMERTGRELMQLQKEWKQTGPAPAEHADQIWERFHTPCDEFFSRRKAFFKKRDEERDGNQKLKEELIRRSEELSLSTQWKETAEELKEIQQEWKNTGPASRKTEQELWTRFRKACDTFFQRRKEFFDEQDRNRLENLRKKEWLCLSLEALARLVLPEDTLETHSPVPSAEHLSIALDFKETVVVPGNRKETWERAIQKVRDIQKEWKSLGPVPQEKDEGIWKRFRSAADIFFTSRSDTGAQRKSGPEGNE